MPHDLSEDALATAFTKTHGRTLRYVKQFNEWLQYDGARWATDSTLRVFDLARALARRSVDEAELPISNPDNRRVRSAATAAAITKLASADRVHAVTPDLLDQDIMLLNTPDGSIDLRTGLKKPNDPDDLCTKVTAAAPGGACPRWSQFLHEITAGDRDLMDYLQRLAGYSLTGSVVEHALVFVYGSGANGKSVFLETLAGVLGDYSTTAPMTTFTESQTEQHPTDVARLRGARLVTAVETEDGKRWAEAKVKSLTGGDTLTARFMRQDFFSFEPQFTLLIAGNHRPRFRGVDESIRRRLHLVPFTVTFAEGQRDPDLKATLRAEWPGILQWAVEGCAAWQQGGLRPPAKVLAATDDYVQEEDTVGAWFAECVVRDPQGWASYGDLFASWSRWAGDRGEYVGSSKRLSEDLGKRGLVSFRRTQARGFVGVHIKPMTLMTHPTISTSHTRAPAHTRTNTPISEAPSSASLTASFRLPDGSIIQANVDDPDIATLRATIIMDDAA